jgi:hypothetical protein
MKTPSDENAFACWTPMGEIAGSVGHGVFERGLYIERVGREKGSCAAKAKHKDVEWVCYGGGEGKYIGEAKTKSTQT